MKINNPELIHKLNEAKRNGLKETKGTGEFGKVLENALDNSDSLKTQKAAGLREPLPSNFLNIQDNSTLLRQDVDSNLELLDKLSKMLEDPGKTVKDVESVLINLIDSVKETRDNFRDEKENAPELFNILENILMVARKEQLRMANGDYN